MASLKPDLSSQQTYFQERLKILSNSEAPTGRISGLLKGHLIVKEETLERTNFLEFLLERFKGALGFGNRTNSQLVERKIIEFLKEGRMWIDEKNVNMVDALAKRVGLMINDNHLSNNDPSTLQHPELNTLIKDIHDTIFNQPAKKTGPLDNVIEHYHEGFNKEGSHAGKTFKVAETFNQTIQTAQKNSSLSSEAGNNEETGNEDLPDNSSTTSEQGDGNLPNQQPSPQAVGAVNSSSIEELFIADAADRAQAAATASQATPERFEVLGEAGPANPKPPLSRITLEGVNENSTPAEILQAAFGRIAQISDPKIQHDYFMRLKNKLKCQFLEKKESSIEDQFTVLCDLAYKDIVDQSSNPINRERLIAYLENPVEWTKRKWTRTYSFS